MDRTNPEILSDIIYRTEKVINIESKINLSKVHFKCDPKRQHRYAQLGCKSGWKTLNGGMNS